jgi:hypothetical protein
LGLNSSTISRCQEIASFGLDFVEYHHYARDVENITETVDWFTSYVKLPIFVSEFSTYEGLSTYDMTTNQRILKDQIQEWETRPNVIGMSYYRFSNDTDPWTIWNKTSNSMRPEGNTLNTYAHGFLNTYPYAYVYNLESTNTTKSISIYDPSFQKLNFWPDRKGWITSHNHTMLDLKNITSDIQTTSPLTSVSVMNFDFDQDFGDWNYWPQLGPPDQFQWKVVNSPTYCGNKALKLWANTTGHNDTQAIHMAIPIVPSHSYFLQAWMKVESVNLGAYAFVSINFRNSSGAWIEWFECEYVNKTSNWTQVYVSAIAPLNAVDMVISLRVRAWNTPDQSMVAYFDCVTMQKTTPATWDGRSYAIAWARGTYDDKWNFAEILQNYTFPNPYNDVQKVWTFKCKLATVQSDEYTTDWKGSFLSLAFTTSDPDEWLSWHDSKYLSLNHQFTELEVSAIPPPNAKGLMMIIKVTVANYGVMFFDDAILQSKPIVVPQNLSISTITGESSEYDFNMSIRALKNTEIKGLLYGGHLTIVSSNADYSGTEFSSKTVNSTTINLHFRMGTPPYDMQLFYAGILGIVLATFAILLIVRTKKKKSRHS